MTSLDDLERLIAEKRREIEKEKTVLGLSQGQKVSHVSKMHKKLPLVAFQFSPRQCIDFPPLGS